MIASAQAVPAIWLSLPAAAASVHAALWHFCALAQAAHLLPEVPDLFLAMLDPSLAMPDLAFA